jgi:hypothetical protein
VIGISIINNDDKVEIKYMLKSLLDNHKITEEEYRKAIDKLNTYK